MTTIVQGIQGLRDIVGQHLGYSGYGSYRGKRFEDVESDLERNWEQTKGNSRLAWNEAKGAVRDGWHYVERAMPGDADRDGR